MEWTRGPTLGRGSSAAVSLATTAAGHLLAVKSTDASSSSFILLQNEQNLLSQLCSPFIVKCFGSDVTVENDKPVCNVFLEYVAGGTLSDLIRENGGSLDESTIRFYTQQLLKGLNYLHLKGFVHCDIKGQNILIGEEGLKIADFGCAKCGGAAGFAGTPAYMAPEAARGEEQSFPADVWALGCTVIEMSTGSNPWPEMKDPASALYRVGYSGDVPEIPGWFSDTAKDFVTRCLMRDPKERWTAGELLQHPLFDSVEIKIREVNKKSPTSVMDQRFWDDVEVSDSSPDPTENASCSDPPLGRIRGLMGGDFDAEWAEDEEDWVTVREFSNYEGLVNGECFNGDHEEEIENSIVVQDPLLYSFSDEINITDFSVLDVLLGDTHVDDYVASVSFESVVMKNSFDSNQFSLPSLLCLLFFPHNFGWSL